MKPIAGSVIALALRGTFAPFNLWAQQNEVELIKQAHVTKHDAKRIARARIKHGTIKCVELEKENGILTWSVDVAQSGKKDLTDVQVDATTGKITAVAIETPLFDSSPGLRCGQGPVAAVPGAAAVGGYDSEMVSSVCR